MDNCEWRQAKAWITSTCISPRNGKAFENSEDLFDFAEALRDGIILCQVVNKLKRDCAVGMMNINNVDQHTFLCKRNINIFLRACHNTFNFEEKHLFTADELYYVTNFKAVIRTLSMLSKTHEATTIHRLIPFSTENHKLRKDSGDDSYSTLPGILENKVVQKDEHLLEEDDENIYDQVENYRQIYDTLVSGARSLKRAKSSVKTSKRNHIVNEILDTEDNYLGYLKVMVENYITPLKSYITAEDKDIIFMNTEHIYSLHLIFNRELSNRKDFSPQESIKMDATAFYRYKERFLIYAPYCAGLATAQQHVADLCNKDGGLRDTVESINKKMTRKFPLQDQLAVLFQRILKYPLLLRDLQKHTPDDHEDSKTIKQAFDAMDDIAKYINEYKRDIECVKEIEQIESSLKYDVPLSAMKNKGRHIKDGELHVFFETSDKREKRNAFLFEHTLLLCKNKGDTNEVKESFDLAKFSIVDVKNIGRGNFSQGWALQAHINDGVTEKKNCKMFAKTQQEKMYWVSEISKCIKVTTLSDYEGKIDKHQLDLTTFDTPESCRVCEKLLKGRVSQGYKCMVPECTLVIHKNCLDNCPKCHPAPVRFRKPNTTMPRSPRANRAVSQHTRGSRAVMKARTRAKTLQEPLSAEEVKHMLLQKQASLDTCTWFIGTLSRDQASDKLKNCIDGSFLIRENEKGWLVLSIVYRNNPLHIKIGHENNLFFLTDAKQFSSIEELLSYYTKNSLVTSFPALPTTLTRMITKSVMRTMTVIYNWEAKTSKELSLRVGQTVSVIDDEGNWWLGRIGSEQGFFPRNHVG